MNKRTGGTKDKGWQCQRGWSPEEPGVLAEHEPRPGWGVRQWWGDTGLSRRGDRAGAWGPRETRVHSVCGEPLGDLSDGFGTQFEGRVHWVCWGAGWGWGASEAMIKMMASGLEQLLVVLLEGWGPSGREGFSEMSAAVVRGVHEG